MGGTPEQAALHRLGIDTGHVVQEFGWDDDVDDSVRAGIEDLTGQDLADEDYNDGADGVLVWFREGDGDLTDLLVDAVGQLFERGYVLLATPRAGREGSVEASDIEEAASTAGLVAGSPHKVSSSWSVIKLMPPRSVTR